MNSDHLEWWRQPDSANQGLFRRFFPRKVHAARAIRVVATISSPAAVANFHLVTSQLAVVDWLLRGLPTPGLNAESFNVEPVPEGAAIDSGLSRSASNTGVIDHPLPREAPPAEASLADRLRAALLVPLDALLPSDGSALEWPSSFKPYQLDGVRALIEKPRILLADDMGLGKTVQAIAAIRILCHQRAIDSALLVVPASIVDQWRREFTRWAPELRVMPVRGPSYDRAWQWPAPAHVKLVSYETLRADFANRSKTGPAQVEWDLVILDEAQKIKNRDSEISRQVKRLHRRRSWAMTGTPLENKVDDLASILEFVDHNGDGTSKTFAPSQALLARHRELQLRRKKSDVLAELPPKQIINISIPLLPRQLAAYQRAENEGIVQLRERGAAIRIEHILELITRLKQLCNRDPVSGESAKLEDIQERLEVLTAEGHRALLFSQYTDDHFGVAAAARYLQAFQPLTFTGALSGGERDAVIQRFKGDDSHRVLILSLRAGGVGLNLQEASYVFHVDRWWNPAVERQAEDRTHRMGQVYPVTVIKYTCLDTIEERINKILAEKQRLFDEIVDDVSVDVASKLSRDDLFGLFGLEPPAATQSSKESRKSGLGLEERCAAILQTRGWEVKRTPLSRDGGIDLVAMRTDEVGLQQSIFIQCKDHARPVGVEIVRELLGVIPAGGGVRAVIAAPSGLTADANRLAVQRNVAVWDEETLVRLELTPPPVTD